MTKIYRIVNDLKEFIYPPLCITCGERLLSPEKYLCINCLADLPVTNFHLSPENTVAEIFWGRVKIENATSFFHYRKGSRYQKLIHFIKYRGMKELGNECGGRFGKILAGSEYYNSTDLIVPVPLHPRKKKKRGYNQSEYIAAGIASALNKPVCSDNLTRIAYTPSQTKKSRYERWQNVNGIFKINCPEDFKNKHILLVDDVITTGSTLEACASEILKITDTKISIATLAYADF